MRNDEERKVFENWFISEGLILTDINPYALVAWDAFQAGAAYQRTQAQPADALVEALDALIADYDGEIHNEYDGTSALDSRLSEINYAREALAAYRAAQEKK